MRLPVWKGCPPRIITMQLRAYCFRWPQDDHILQRAGELCTPSVPQCRAILWVILLLRLESILINPSILEPLCLLVKKPSWRPNWKKQMTPSPHDTYAFQLFAIKKKLALQLNILQRDSKLSFPHGWKLDFFSLSLECDLFTFQPVPLHFVVQHKENDVYFIKWYPVRLTK